MSDTQTYPLDLTEEQRDALPEFSFVAVEEFTWFRGDALVGRYHPGQDYHCTRQPRHDELRAMCQTWLAEGKVAVTALSGGRSFTGMTLGG